VGASNERQVEELRFERLLGRLLLTGVVVAALVSAVGLVLLFTRGANIRLHDQTFHAEPANLRTIRGVLAGALGLRPESWIQLGLLLLVATPIARVAFAAVGFAVRRDRFYVVVTLVVLLLLIFGLIGLNGRG
jgi:uncharacterized membrane protein